MNGTVTMSTHGVVVDAPDFPSAKIKVKSCPTMPPSAVIHSENVELFYYSIPGEWPVVGMMKNEPVKVI
jgi:hypothetical protein